MFLFIYLLPFVGLNNEFTNICFIVVPILCFRFTSMLILQQNQKEIKTATAVFMYVHYQSKELKHPNFSTFILLKKMQLPEVTLHYPSEASCKFNSFPSYSYPGLEWDHLFLAWECHVQAKPTFVVVEETE